MGKLDLLGIVNLDIICCVFLITMSIRPGFSGQSLKQDLCYGLMLSLFIPTVLLRLPDNICYKRDFSESRY